MASSDFGYILKNLSLADGSDTWIDQKFEPSVRDRSNIFKERQHNDSSEVDGINDMDVDDMDVDTSSYMGENVWNVNDEHMKINDSYVGIAHSTPSNENENEHKEDMDINMDREEAIPPATKKDTTIIKSNHKDRSISVALSKALLSPTRLGMQLAIMPKVGPKVSSASEMCSDSRETSFHYEFDTDSANESTAYDTFKQYKDKMALRKRLTNEITKSKDIMRPNEILQRDNSASFPSNDLPFDMNDKNRYETKGFTSGSYNTKLSGFPTHQKASFDSFAWERGPIQIHHHHYYDGFESLRSKDSSDTLTSEKGVQNIEQKEAVLSGLELPNPWNDSSVPQERVPYLLSSYLQLFINFSVSGYAAYLIYSIISAIKQDINHKLYQHTIDMMVEVETCRRSFEENNCDPESIVPILEKPCAYWKKCMNQDPFTGGGNTSRISAHTLGVIVNSLIEPLGIKFFLAMFLFIAIIFLCNFTLGFIRAKMYFGWGANEYVDTKI